MNSLLLDQTTQAIDLFERVHQADGSLAEEYPLIFGQGFTGSIVGVGDSELRSACSLLARDFVMRGTHVPIGLIGSVSTDESYREQGLATEVLLRAEAELIKQGSIASILWADDPTFYLSRGYNAIGNEVDFRMGIECAASLPRSSGARRRRDADNEGIHALYQQHACRVERTAQETAALLACPRMETLVLERDGEVLAYACCGRGRDLENTIHEWGGETSLVLSLIRAHLERRFGEGMSDAQGHLFLMSPIGEEKLHAALLAAGATQAKGILALGRILDAQGAARLLEERFAGEGTVAVESTEQGPLFRVTGPADEGELNEDAVLALLFGTADVQPQIDGFLERFGFTVAELPLQPFAWGLDSI